jgi:transcriptional antiterminator NusG
MIYVVHVQSGKEMAVRDELRRSCYRAMVPRENALERVDGRLRQRERTLFTGYVFVDMAMDLKSYYKIRNNPHVIRFLGGKQPIELTAAEARYIEWLAGGGKPLQPSELDKDGAVMTGPLKGHEQSVVSVNKRAKRAKVRITLAGEPHEISLSVVTAAGDSDGDADGDR